MEHEPNRNSLLVSGAIALGLLFCLGAGEAGTFIFADGGTPTLITHPPGYLGAGGNVNVTVCIDPASANAAAMQPTVKNIVATYNSLTPIVGNLDFPGTNPTGSQIDFESVALHEVGHCLGLGHSNLADTYDCNGGDPGVGQCDEQNATSADVGGNSVLNVGSGVDAVFGSSDDQRVDDVNVHWFRMINNNPFTIATTVDSTTYSRDLADLPGGSFAANADRAVSNLLALSSTEAVMNQGSFFGEAQRALCHDDVAALRYGQSGLDEIAGNGDDYTMTLTYAGLTNSCDIVLDFDNAQTGFAVCKVSAQSISGSDHFRITQGHVYFNTGFNWYFNSQSGAIFTDGFESGSTSAWSSAAP